MDEDYSQCNPEYNFVRLDLSINNSAISGYNFRYMSPQRCYIESNSVRNALGNRFEDDVFQPKPILKCWKSSVGVVCFPDMPDILKMKPGRTIEPCIKCMEFASTS